MSKVAVIYWSGTGNTKMMAEAVSEGAKNAGADVSLLNVSETNAAEAASFDVLALGCPAMGGEVLEEMEFEPFFTELESKLFLAPMAGETDSGCVTGRNAPLLLVPRSFPAKV